MWVVTITNWIWGATKKDRVVPKFLKSPLEKMTKGHLRVVFWSQHWTYQLNSSEIFLPPQVLLVARAHSSQAIVRVHDNMDNTVKQGVECAHTTWNEKRELEESHKMSKETHVSHGNLRKPYLVQTELQTTRWTAWLSDGRHEEMSPGYSFSLTQRRPEMEHK